MNNSYNLQQLEEHAHGVQGRIHKITGLTMHKKEISDDDRKLIAGYIEDLEFYISKMKEAI